MYTAYMIYRKKYYYYRKTEIKQTKVKKLGQNKNNTTSRRKLPFYTHKLHLKLIDWIGCLGIYAASEIFQPCNGGEY